MAAKLAIDGGTPVRENPFPPRIMFDDREMEVTVEIMRKCMIGDQALDRYGGTHVDAYEREMADYVGTRYATATSSGTAAIHAALGALRLEPCSEIITSPITDPGTVAPILLQNCIPIFADVDYDTMTLSPQSIQARITEKTRAIIVVHLAGQPCDMDPVVEIANRYKLTVIEDCAQAHGSRYKGRIAGSIGDMGTFSLMSGKHTTSAGQGGMVTTSDAALYWNAKRFADRGKPFNSSDPTNLFLGENYRMTELQAAIGRIQLTKLEAIREKRQYVIDCLQERMQDLQAISLWNIRSYADINPWFCFLHYDSAKMTVDKWRCAAALQKEGIPVGAHYVTPIYNQTWIKNRQSYGSSGYPWTAKEARPVDYTHCCPRAEQALDDHMTLYIHEGWGQKEIDDVMASLRKVEDAYLK